MTHELHSVQVNGREHTQINAARGTISLGDLTGTMRVKATFMPK